MISALPSVFMRQRLADLISLSKMPPQQGTFSKLNDHSNWRSEKCFLITGSVNRPQNEIVLEADLNVLPLSDIILAGTPQVHD